MKKVISLLLILGMLAGMAAVFSSCGKAIGSFELIVPRCLDACCSAYKASVKARCRLMSVLLEKRKAREARGKLQRGQQLETNVCCFRQSRGVSPVILRNRFSAARTFLYPQSARMRVMGRSVFSSCRFASEMRCSRRV